MNIDLSRAVWRKSSFSNGNGGDCVEVTGITWRKSSHSNGTGGECVEVTDLGVAWRKSSHSNGSGGACVETATGLSGIVAVRDSKNPAGPSLIVTPTAWRTFLTGIRADCR